VAQESEVRTVYLDANYKPISSPPYEPRNGLPNAMWSMSGKPTIFGAPDCDGEGLCTNDLIFQYEPELDVWRLVGKLAQPRNVHQVATFPRRFCANLGFPQADRPSAALLVGGNADPQGVVALSSVELIGCPGVSSIRLRDFPVPTYLAAGTYVNDKALVCGGQACDDTGTCSNTNNCYEWNAEEDEWTQVNSLVSPRSNFIMAPYEDGLVAIGSSNIVESFDLSTEEWRQFQSIFQASSWFGVACLVEVDGVIYSVRRSLESVDTSTWTVRRDYPRLPSPLLLTGQCSTLEIDGEKGIFLSNG